MTQLAPEARLPWFRLVGLTLFALAFGVGTNTLDPSLLGYRILELGPAQRNTALGLITAAGLLVAVLTQPLVGALSDRIRSPLGPRIPFFALGTAIAISALYWVAWAPTLAALLLAVMLYQAGSNTAQGPWQALLPDRVPSAQRGGASGLKSFFEILAFILGRRVSGYLLADSRPTAAVSIAAGVFVLGLLLTTAAAWGRRRGAQSGSAQTHSTGAPWSGSQSHAFRWWFVHRALFWGGIIALNTFILFFLIDVIEMPFEEASRFFADLSAVLGAGVLIAAIPAGRLADRLGRRPIIIASGLLAAAGTGTLLVVRSHPALILVAGMLGLATGTWLSASWALLTDIVPPAQAARYMGIANIATAGGSLVSRFAGALIIDPINRLTASTQNGYLSLYSLTLVGFLVATWAISKIPRRSGSEAARDAGLGV